MYDILIKNGLVFDGSGKPGLRTDIAISEGKIVEVKDLPEATAHDVIDASHLYIAPGFIDIQNHSDSHGYLLLKPALEGMVLQGITTLVLGQCGASLAPLPVSESLNSLQKWGDISGLNADWKTYGEFVNRVSGKTFGANVISFIGHGTLRRSFTGDSNRELTGEEIEQLAGLLERNFLEGASGVSFGFQYSHEIKTSKQEILSLLAVVKKYDKIFSVHLRSHENLLESVREVIELAREAGVKLKISHLKHEGRTNLGELYMALDLIEQAYQSGLNVHFDVYPYTTSWGALYTYLPPVIYGGGFKPMLARIGDKDLRPKILQELSEKRNLLSSLLVSTSPKVQNFVSKTVGHIAQSQNIAPEEAVLRILSANHGQAVVFDHNIDPEQTTLLLSHPFSFVASDGVGYPLKADGIAELPHPRCFGTFPRFLRLIRPGDDAELPLMVWPQAIAKITSQASDFLKLQGRGLIKRDFFADITIFDPQTVSDKATYSNPFRPPDGIRYVINNGKISVFEGQLTTIYAGKVLSSQ